MHGINYPKLLEFGLRSTLTDWIFKRLGALQRTLGRPSIRDGQQWTMVQGIQNDHRHLFDVKTGTVQSVMARTRVQNRNCSQFLRKIKFKFFKNRLLVWILVSVGTELIEFFNKFCLLFATYLCHLIIIRTTILCYNILHYIIL